MEKDTKQEGHPFVLINDSDAVPEETFAFIISSYNKSELEGHKNDYNFKISPNGENKLGRDSLVQCFYVCKVTKDNLLEQRTTRSVSDIQLQLFPIALQTFMNDHPEIEVVNDGTKIKVVKDDHNYKIINESVNNHSAIYIFNTKVDDIDFNYIIEDDWWNAIRGSMLIQIPQQENIYFNFVYDYEVNSLSLYDMEDGNAEIELTDDSDVYTVLRNGIIEEDFIPFLTYSFIDLLNNYDRFVEENNIVEY